MLHSFSGINIIALRCVLPEFTVPAEQQLQYDGLTNQDPEQVLKQVARWEEIFNTRKAAGSH